MAHSGDNRKEFGELIVNDATRISKSTVQQTGNITDQVTVNSGAGIIKTITSSLASNSATTFVVNNTSVQDDSVILASVIDYIGGTTGVDGVPNVSANNIANGSFNVILANQTGAPLAGNVCIGFQIL